MRTRYYPWVLVGLLWVVAVLNYVDRQIIFSVFPLLQADLKISNVQLGLLSTVFLWVYGLLGPFAGFLADRYGRKRVILLSFLVWSLVTWATGHAPNITYLLWARGLMGISEACYMPAALALIADNHSESTRSLATGLHQSALYVGIVLGGVGGGWLGGRFGWRLAFTVLGGIGVLYMVVLAYLLKNTSSNVPGRQSSDPPRFISSMKELFSLSGFVTLTGVFSIASMANQIVYTWLPLYLYEDFRMSLTTAGFSSTFYIQAASVTGILVGGWMADRWSLRNSRGRLFIQTVGLAVAGPFLFLTGFSSHPALLVLSLILFGFGRGFYDCNAMPVLAQIARVELWSTGYGVFNFAGGLTGGVITVVAGYLKASIGLGAMLQITAVLLSISAIMLLRIRIVSTALVEVPSTKGNKRS